MIGTEIEKARDLLLRNEVVAIPTETVYGLAGNALSEIAVSKIFEAKNRPHFDPLIVHVSEVSEVSNYVEEIPELAFNLMEHFWPGALTVLLPKKTCIPDLTTSGLKEVGIRIPNHPVTLELLRSLPFPLAAPSANPFGYISPTSAQHVSDQLGEKIPYILNGGNCSLGIESTVLRVQHNEIEILRLGGISVEDLQRFSSNIHIQQHSSSSPAAPGMLTSHYAPRKPVYIGNIRELMHSFASQKIGVLSFKEDYQIEAQRILSKSGSFTEAASNLFAFLRELDQLDIDVILAEFLPNENLGRAINDKLRRASAK
ncbi:MAG: L-threonylcarbamoyladenylate synthase [Flavobacteriales bacterium]|nr:L-threonylcarbamoyladenylate synthase [Flavobacteriales bacterium]MDP4732273.1 L-threonylcarbamoyladenylate synthase [Flavobacteriales bacterium]